MPRSSGRSSPRPRSSASCCSSTRSGFTHAQRMSEYYFNNLIGNPLESTLAIGHLIFGGVLDRYPGLRICVAHGGGYMPGYWGRMDHGWRARGDCSEHCQHEPSSYLRKLWLDTLVFDQDQLDSLVRTHGADKLCLGTDYPFDMSEPDPVGFHARLDEADKAQDPRPERRRAAGLAGPVKQAAARRLRSRHAVAQRRQPAQAAATSLPGGI